MFPAASLRRQPAVTLVELLVALLVSSVLVSMTVSVYSLFRKSMIQDLSKASIAQNGRIAMDRMSRELRQTPDIKTNLPASPSDTTVAQPGEIEFEDGHAEDLTYKRYYLSGTSLKLQVKEYYFASDPTLRVKWNTVGPAGATPVSSVIQTYDVADMVQSLAFYGDEDTQIVLVTGDGLQSLKLQTTIAGRNR